MEQKWGHEVDCIQAPPPSCGACPVLGEKGSPGPPPPGLSTVKGRSPKGGERSMLRKVALVCAVAGAVLFPIAALSEDHGHDHDHGHSAPTYGPSGHNHDHDHDNDHQHHAHDEDHDHDHHHDHDHDHHHDHAGHYWHGHYYEYGVGACWRWTPVGFVWACF